MFNKNLCLSIEDINKDIENLELKSRVEMIGNEGIIDSISSVATHINNGLNGMVDIYKKLFTSSNQLANVDFLSRDVKILNIDLNKVKSKIEKNGHVLYDTLGSIELPVTLGLKVDAVTLLQTLKPCLKSIGENLVPNLKDTGDYITKLITSEDTRLASRPNIKSNLRELDYLLEYKGIEKVIDVNGVKDRMRFDKFYPNMKSVEEAVKLISEDEKLLDVKHLESIKKLTLEVSETTDLLYKFILENPKTSINKNTLYELADRLEVLASVTTNAMSIIFLFKSCMETVKESIRVIDIN